MFQNSLFSKKLTTDGLNSLVNWIADLVWTVVDYKFILIFFSLKRQIKERYLSEESEREEEKRRERRRGMPTWFIILFMIFFVIYFFMLAMALSGKWKGSGSSSGDDILLD